MKRDWDLIKKILIHIEEWPPDHMPSEVEINDIEPEIVSYHVKILHNGDLIEAFDVSSQECAWYAIGLTWKGHEFLDAIRNESVWSKVKSKLAAAGGSLPIEVIKTLAIETAKSIVLS